MYPNVENMILVLITKRIEISTSIQVCLISQMNINYREMVEGKLFLLIQSVKIVYPNRENVIIVPITKRIEIIASIKVCLIL